MLQNHAALPSGQINIENHERGTWRACIRIRLVEVPDSLLSIADYMDCDGKRFRPDRFPHEEHVRIVIFNDEHKAGGAGSFLFRRGV